MSNSIEPLRANSKRPLSIAPWKALLQRLAILAVTFLGLAGTLSLAAAAEKTEELYFAGKLVELDAARHTFTIRSRNKELVFTIDPARCDITVDGSMTERKLRWARIGDAVMGELSLKEAKPYVTWVEFTHHPLTGKLVEGKPGLILSPYLPRWPEPWHHSEPTDARQLAHGDMVLDEVSGKIFLVP